MTASPILVILGPTASGKSDLAVMLAKKFNGEVISADSRQVYKDMNVGTGKITRKEMQGIPHHLLDIADPRHSFSVVKYQKLANEAITDIQNRGKLPIICGGTGYYIDAVLNDQNFPVTPMDNKLRAKLSGKSADQLLAILVKLDPHRAKVMGENNSERHNVRRLIRAIEVAKANIPFARTKLSASKKGERSHNLSRSQPQTTRASSMVTHVSSPNNVHYHPIVVGLAMPRNELRSRIKTRLIKRLKHGMIAEVKQLHARGLTWKRMDELGLEYRYISRFLQGKMTVNEMRTKLETEISRYVKRQMTWWKRNKEIKWFAPKDSRKIQAFIKSQIS